MHLSRRLSLPLQSGGAAAALAAFVVVAACSSTATTAPVASVVPSTAPASAAPASAAPASAAPATPAVADSVQITVAQDPKLGSFLAGTNGMTLYVFRPDKPDQSTCEGQCATAWPPLLVKSASAVTAGPGVTGKLATFARSDGTLQVSYNGAPLYYWFKDKQPGDVTGQGVQNVWFVASPASEAASAAAVQVNWVQDAKLGKILVGAGGMTLYLFKPDKTDQSTCSGQCAAAWPPLTVTSATAVSAGAGVSGKLATFARSDGTLQVSYNGTPLYYFASDKLAGDVTGQGVQGVWFIVAP